MSKSKVKFRKKKFDTETDRLTMTIHHYPREKGERPVLAFKTRINNSANQCLVELEEKLAHVMESIIASGFFGDDVVMSAEGDGIEMVREKRQASLPPLNTRPLSQRELIKRIKDAGGEL